jgi:DNA replication protein
MTQTPTQDPALTVLMTSGFVAIPGILLRSYKRLGLGDEEMMLLLHLIEFRQEGIPYPTPHEISERMMIPEDIISKMLLNLIREGFLQVEERIGVRIQELYDLRPLYDRLNELLQPKVQAQPPLSSLDLLEKKDKSIFELFEQEFGRPLSPLEYEKIVRWIDEDQYGEELIREALREAVLAAKFNFKYIDRILFEWQKNHIRTMQELNVYREQYRNRIPSRQGATGGGAAKSKSKARDKANDTPGQDLDDKYDAFYKMYGRE